MPDDRIVRGMRAQFAAREQQIAAGDRPLGWKAGFGSPAAMMTLGTDHPLIGYLMHSALTASGATLALADFSRPAIETEIAVYLGADIDGDASRDSIAAAISGLGPAIEIVDVSFPPGDGVENILAGNIYQKRVVLGPVDDLRAGASLHALVAAVQCNGAAIDIAADLEANTGAILDVVGVAAKTLAEMGGRLAAGELIIAGSLIAPLFVTAESKLTFTLGDAEPLSIAFS